jgi:hypothetical protein
MPRVLLACVSLCCAASAFASAEAVPPYQQDFPPEEFQARWARVFDAIGPEAVALVQGTSLAGG